MTGFRAHRLAHQLDAHRFKSTLSPLQQALQPLLRALQQSAVSVSTDLSTIQKSTVSLVNHPENACLRGYRLDTSNSNTRFRGDLMPQFWGIRVVSHHSAPAWRPRCSAWPRCQQRPLRHRPYRGRFRKRKIKHVSDSPTWAYLGPLQETDHSVR